MHACCASESGGKEGEVALRLLLLRAVLLDRRDVVGGQQVQRVEPAVGQAAQVAHAVAAVVGEGEVGAAVAGGHRLVGDREVPDVELVDRRVLGLIELRLAQPVPAVWLVLVEVDEQRAARVEAEPERVRVGDHVGDHLVRHVDGHRVGVRRVLPRRPALDPPDAVAPAAHGEPALAEDELDVLGRRRPDRELRRAAVPGRPEPRVRRARVEVVEHAGDLHAREADELAAGVVGGDDELAGEQLAGGANARRGQLEGVEGGQVREVARHRRAGRRQGVRVAGDRPVDDLQPALGRHVQPVARGVRRIPREQPAAQPVRGTHSAQDHRGIVADHVGRMVVGEGDAGRPAPRAGCSSRPAPRRRRSSRPTCR